MEATRSVKANAMGKSFILDWCCCSSSTVLQSYQPSLIFIWQCALQQLQRRYTATRRGSLEASAYIACQLPQHAVIKYAHQQASNLAHSKKNLAVGS